MNARQRRTWRRGQLALLGRLVKFVEPGYQGYGLPHTVARVTYLPQAIGKGPVWWVGTSFTGEWGRPVNIEVPMRNLRAVER